METEKSKKTEPAFLAWADRQLVIIKESKLGAVPVEIWVKSLTHSRQAWSARPDSSC